MPIAAVSEMRGKKAASRGADVGVGGAQAVLGGQDVGAAEEDLGGDAGGDPGRRDERLETRGLELGSERSAEQQLERMAVDGERARRSGGRLTRAASTWLRAWCRSRADPTPASKRTRVEVEGACWLDGLSAEGQALDVDGERQVARRGRLGTRMICSARPRVPVARYCSSALRLQAAHAPEEVDS